MTGIVLRIVVVALGLWLAAEIFPGLEFDGPGTLFAAALLLGGGFLGHAFGLWRDDSDVTAMRTFRFSILYLFLLFAAMVVDRALGDLLALGARG